MKLEWVLSLVLGSFALVVVVVSLRRRVVSPAALSRLGELLGGGYDLGAGYAWGAALGVSTTIRFTHRFIDGQSEEWTELEVALPAGYPLELFLRRHHDWRDRTRGERREELDVELGDPAFDVPFLVEAAPLEIARILLDVEARTFLAGSLDFELSTQVARGPVLRFAVPGWLEDLPAARHTALQLIRIATGVRAAYARAEREGLAVRGGSPFRSEPDAQLIHEVAAARRSEVLLLRLCRRRRKRPFPLGFALSVVGKVALFVIFAFAFGSMVNLMMR